MSDETDMKVIDFEYFDLFCTNIFGVKESFTFQEYSLAFYIRSNPEYYLTVEGLESLCSKFLLWQNVSFPTKLFFFDNHDDLYIKANYSHDNDFTWNSCIKLLKENARKVFLFHPELPETLEEYIKRTTKDELIHDTALFMDSVFEKRMNNA